MHRDCLPVSVIIPNWNGAALLTKFLPLVLRALEQHHPDSECIVVDDGSTDQSRDLLRVSFPGVRLVERERNRGFSSAINEGISHSRHGQLILLNNDVAVTPNFIAPLQTAYAAHRDTFAVASLQQQTLADGRIGLDGFNLMRWKAGHLEFLNWTAEVIAGQTASLAYCTAGCSLYSKEKLTAIGGFCELFDPFYCEDTEVCLQAIRRGWRLAFAPESVVEHHHGTTTRRKPWQLKLIPVRNYFFLHWLLLDRPSLWWQHFFGVSFRAIGWTLQGRFRYPLGLAAALWQVPAIARQRRTRQSGATRSALEALYREQS